MKHLLHFLVIFFTLSSNIHSQTSNAIEEQAYIAFNNNNYTKALALYNKLIISEPKEAQYYTRRAYCYYYTKSFEKAISDCGKSLLLDNSIANKTFVLKMRADCNFLLEKWEDALKDYDNYLEYYFDDIKANKLKAEVLFKLNKYKESIENLKFLLKYKGEYNIEIEDKVDIYTLLGFNYINLDSIESSKLFYNKALSFDSTGTNLLYLFAQICDVEEDYKTEINAYNKMLLKDSSLYFAVYFRAQAYYNSKQYGMAIKDFKTSKKYFPKNHKLYYMLGNAEMENKNYFNAQQSYKVCIKLNPKSSTYYNQAGWCCFLMKNYKEGLIYANQAVLIDKKNGNATDTRGCIYYRLGDYKNSIKDFDKSIAIDSTIANSYYFRGLVYTKIHNKINACSDWNFLLKLKDYVVLEGEKPIEQLLRENCE